MKTALFALACLGCLASSAFANPSPDKDQNASETNKINYITKVLDDIGKKDVPASALTAQKYSGLEASQLSADGEIQLTGQYQVKSETSGLIANAGVTLTTFHISLKVVDGKIVGVAATEEIQKGSAELMTAAVRNAQQSTPTTKSWVYGPADFVARHGGHDAHTDGKPSSISSETKPKNANGDRATSANQEKSVACTTVSPSSPGCP